MLSPSVQFCNHTKYEKYSLHGSFVQAVYWNPNPNTNPQNINAGIHSHLKGLLKQGMYVMFYSIAQVNVYIINL